VSSVLGVKLPTLLATDSTDCTDRGEPRAKSVGLLEKDKPLLLTRQETDIVKSADNGMGPVQEEVMPYGQK
jgi:hypothetical protein